MSDDPFLRGLDGSEHDCDGACMVENATVKVHRIVLRKRCKVLFDMIEESSQEPIKIEGIDTETFQEVRKFITGKSIHVSYSREVLTIKRRRY